MGGKSSLPLPDSCLLHLQALRQVPELWKPSAYEPVLGTVALRIQVSERAGRRSVFCRDPRTARPLPAPTAQPRPPAVCGHLTWLQRQLPADPQTQGFFRSGVLEGLRDQQLHAVHVTGETEAQRGGRTRSPRKVVADLSWEPAQDTRGSLRSSTQKALLRHGAAPRTHSLSLLAENLESSLPGKQCHGSVYKPHFDIRQTLVRIPVLPVTCHDLGRWAGE